MRHDPYFKPFLEEKRCAWCVGNRHVVLCKFNNESRYSGGFLRYPNCQETRIPETRCSISGGKQLCGYDETLFIFDGAFVIGLGFRV